MELGRLISCIDIRHQGFKVGLKILFWDETSEFVNLDNLNHIL